MSLDISRLAAVLRQVFHFKVRWGFQTNSCLLSGEELAHSISVRLVKHRRPDHAIQHGAVKGEIQCPSKGGELQCAP